MYKDFDNIFTRDLLEIRENDQTDDQGHDRETMTYHGQVVETDGKLQGQSTTLYIINKNVTFFHFI